MTEAGSQLGLSPAQAYQLALGTFAGATALAQDSPDTPELLRQKVTSKGGTTHAAISAMDASGLKPQFVAAMRAAHARAEAMGVEFGTD
jgi:pyrroline-5-carboxylate reductase